MKESRKNSNKNQTCKWTRGMKSIYKIEMISIVLLLLFFCSLFCMLECLKMHKQIKLNWTVQSIGTEVFTFWLTIYWIPRICDGLFISPLSILLSMYTILFRQKRRKYVNDDDDNDYAKRYGNKYDFFIEWIQNFPVFFLCLKNA